MSDAMQGPLDLGFETVKLKTVGKKVDFSEKGLNLLIFALT